jgi:hypothetical protein
VAKSVRFVGFTVLLVAILRQAGQAPMTAVRQVSAAVTIASISWSPFLRSMVIGMISLQKFLCLFGQHWTKRGYLVAAVQFGFALAAVTSASSASSQDNSSFFRAESRSISNSGASACEASGLGRLPVRCWVGQQFIVLPKDKAARNQGYPEIEGMAPRYGHPTYSELAGKTVKVTKVEWQQYSLSPDLSGWIITFQTGGNGLFYTANAVPHPGEGRDDAVVDCLALLRDLQLARGTYLNKRYWPLTPRLPPLDDDGVSALPGYVILNKFEAVTVVDVLVSSAAEAPVRIVVNNDLGQEGYFDIAMSKTNRSSLVKPGIGSFANFMSDEDPKLAHNWPEDVWKAIENGKVLQGMTMEQVRLSLGSPIDVSRTTVENQAREQWVYGDGNYLYFDDGVLISTSH